MQVGDVLTTAFDDALAGGALHSPIMVVALRGWFDVAEAFAGKLLALQARESQTGHMHVLEGRIRGWMTMQAQQGGLPEGRLAEAFMIVSTA